MSDIVKNLDVTEVSRIVTCSRQEFEESYKKTPNEYTMYFVPSQDFNLNQNLFDIPDSTATQDNSYYSLVTYSTERIAPYSADFLVGRTFYYHGVSSNEHFKPEIVFAYREFGSQANKYVGCRPGNSSKIPITASKITYVEIRNRSDSSKYNNVTTTVSQNMISFSPITSFVPYQKGPKMISSGTLYYGSRVLKDVIPVKGYPQGRDYPLNKIYVVFSDDESKIEGLYYKLEVDSREVILQVAKPVMRQVVKKDGFLEIQWSDSLVCKYLVLDSSGSLPESQLERIVGQIANIVRNKTKILWKEIKSLPSFQDSSESEVLLLETP